MSTTELEIQKTRQESLRKKISVLDQELATIKIAIAREELSIKYSGKYFKELYRSSYGSSANNFNYIKIVDVTDLHLVVNRFVTDEKGSISAGRAIINPQHFADTNYSLTEISEEDYTTAIKSFMKAVEVIFAP